MLGSDDSLTYWKGSLGKFKPSGHDILCMFM
jgi:hypothetical protein